MDRRLGGLDDARAQGPGRCVEHDFAPLFKLEHMLKDVQLCLEEARGGRRAVPVRRRWPASSTAPGVGRGLGEQDFAAVLEVVEGLTGDAAVTHRWRVGVSLADSVPSAKILLICREILGFRDFVHSM